MPTLKSAFQLSVLLLEAQLSLGGRWQLNSRFDYQVFPQGPFAGAQKQLEIRILGFDLLNRNLGSSRNAAFTYIGNSRMVALVLYFMLSAVYNLKGFGQ